MAKNKANVVISKKELLLPKMEFLPLDETGRGFYVRELGGKSLLDYRELIKRIEQENGEGNEPTEAQSIELMTVLVQMTACNADGSLYFETKDEAELFADKSLVQLEMVATKAMELAGMGANKNLKNDVNSSSTDS